MFAVDQLILIGSLLLLIGIASSKFSARLGLPVLVLFLGVGMLAGSEGLGGIAFENYTIAHGIGTLALAIILFDGGLRTPLSSFRTAVYPSVALATAGVLLTALVTGFAASTVLDIPLLEGLLLGSIVGSTDAAAVFSILRSKGLNLPDRLASTLEIESGSNDPMAIFLTIGLLEISFGRMSPGPELLGFFALQMSVGAVAGIATGRGTVALTNRINLETAGLYPVLTTAAGLLAYGLAASLGGSGFLAVYLAGLAIGNGSIVFRRGIFLFHDGAAWLAQIVMFVLLGLVVFPSRLAEVAHAGLLIAAVLIFIARPVAVALLLVPFRFAVREIALIAWVGLKGAVPIVLATYPLLFGLPNGPLLFNVTFFVVLVSAVTQGWSLPLVARRLGLQRPARTEPPITLEIASIRHVDSDIVDYTVVPDSPSAGRLVHEIALPEGAVIALIARGSRVIPPRGNTRIEAGDHVFVVVDPDVRAAVDRAFSRTPDPFATDRGRAVFLLRGDATAENLETFYGIRAEADPATTLDALFRRRLGHHVAPGSALAIGPLTLFVHEMNGDRVSRVLLAIRPDPGRRTQRR